jgi:hypothetical protein
MKFVVYERVRGDRESRAASGVTNVIWLWGARLTWAALPAVAGDALADALDDWPRAPVVVAVVLLWSAWLAGLIALLAPRPWGLTALRVVAPIATVVTVASVPSSSAVSGTLAVVGALVAAVFALAPPVAERAANALAYGDEVRFPLRVPTPLLALPVPIAVLFVAAGIASGPLLLADGRVVAGVLALAAGLPLAAFLGRSLHALSRRWLVLVPAGAVIADPLILLDPVLLRTEQITSVAPAPAAASRALDLRLGTARGLMIALREPVSFGRRSGRASGVMVAAQEVLVAPIRRARVLLAARERRIATERR